ncbi:MAG: hypothetical protein C0482_04810 [Gordonia sp.]|nr:hypothetical protein [Gordonia sp. (in: high G+C Gram-positive bacteria)]
MGVFDRRRFLTGLAAVGAGFTALTVVPSVFTGARTYANSLPPVRETVCGVLAFVVPGNDHYSRAQGMATGRAGGVTPGTADSLTRTLDRAVPFPVLGPAFGITLPGAAAIAALLNVIALSVEPNSVRGAFSAPFANLSHARKAQVFDVLDTHPLIPGLPIKFAVNAIPTLAAFAAYSETSAFDPRTRTLTGRPVGWELSRYDGVSDGWDEFRGYYRGVQ